MPATIAVEATDKKYFGLKHMPGRLSLDAFGKGVWPADQFTFRMIQDGALREVVVSAAPAPAPLPSAPSSPAASSVKS